MRQPVSRHKSGGRDTKESFAFRLWPGLVLVKWTLYANAGHKWCQ